VRQDESEWVGWVGPSGKDPNAVLKSPENKVNITRIKEK
jgi:hypothetical protein